MLTARPSSLRSSAHVPVGASLIALSAGVVWSFGAVFAKLAEHSDAFQYLLWRSVGILLVMETVTAARRGRPMILRAYRSGKWMLVANLGLFLASLMYVYALKTTTAANASFLSSVTPLVAVVLARWILKERLTAPTAIALSVALVGLLITVLADLSAGSMLGNVAAVLSSVGFAIYTIGVRSDPKADWSPVLPGYAAMMIVVCGSVTAASGRPLFPGVRDVALGVTHGAVFIVVGTLLFNYASRHLPAVPMTVFAQTEMVFVPIWALLLLDEVPSLATVVGGAVILAAIVGKAWWDARSSTVSPAP